MNSASPNYSVDKAVAPDTGGLEVVPSDDLPQVVDGFAMKPVENGWVGAAAGQGARKTVCGLQRSTFILAVLLAVVVVAAAVGGGVGGSMAVSKAYE
ncbi:hypothetical protein IMZ48_24390 [Candidatus Bathyarchaeota archaeon]|nr:hypothetical protein [Candidatus Bathyarchaeota archaeon]